MANHKSAEKRARQSITRRQRNKHFLTQMRNSIREIRKGIEGKKVEGLTDQLKALTSKVQKLVSKGTIHKNTGSRYISRISQKVQSLLKK